MDRPTIASIRYAQALSWCSDTMAFTNVTYKAYLEVFVSALLAALQKGASEALESLSSLPVTNQQKIIEAPETYALLNSVLRNNDPIEKLIIFIKRSAAVERCRLGQIDLLAHRQWSAIGDYFFDHPSSITRRDSAGWRREGQYSAKSIASIPIDHESIFCRASMPVEPFRSVSYGSASPFTLDEAREAEEKIISAFSKLELACPSAARFFLKYVKSIVLRKNVDESNIFQSASRNSYIGQVVLLNPHVPHVDEAYIAESLVHESIHALMWRQEVLSNFLIDPTLDMGTVKSPWSGEEIFYYTLLQAGFVWYGIANFWRHALERNIFPFKRAEELYRRAVGGFRDGKLLACLRCNESNLQRGIIHEFCQMTEYALALPRL